MPTVWIPYQFQKYTNGEESVVLKGNSLREVIEGLDRTYPGIRERLCEGDSIRSTLAVAVDGEFITDGLRHRLEAENEINFLPALSGGSFNQRTCYSSSDCSS